MEHDEFIGQVQHLGRMPSRGDAEAATRATLETLGECLQGGTAHNLASQLPPEIGRHLEGHEFDRSARDEFFDRVCSREHRVDKPQSVFHARAVVEVLKAAVTPGTLQGPLTQLPPRFHRLFEAGAHGNLDWSDDGGAAQPMPDSERQDDTRLREAQQNISGSSARPGH